MKEELKGGEEGPCRYCGEPGVAQVDPFNWEILSDETLHLLCEHCAGQRREEI
jgi:hypothetical protein